MGEQVGCGIQYTMALAAYVRIPFAFVLLAKRRCIDFDPFRRERSPPIPTSSLCSRDESRDSRRPSAKGNPVRGAQQRVATRRRTGSVCSVRDGGKILGGNVGLLYTDLSFSLRYS